MATARRDVAVLIDPDSPALRRKDVVRLNELEARRRHARDLLGDEYNYRLDKMDAVTRRVVRLKVFDAIMVLVGAVALVAAAWIMAPVLAKSTTTASAFTAGVGSVLTLVLGHRIRAMILSARARAHEPAGPDDKRG